MLFEWNFQKNEKLKRERGISFEDVVLAIEKGFVLGKISNEKYPEQNIFLINVNQYVWAIPTEQ